MTFLERFKTAVKHEVAYWDERNDPPNMAEATFLRYVEFLREPVEPKWDNRKSEKGKYAHIGEKQVFDFTQTISATYGKVTVYIKGFFFPDGKTPQGVEIQSCRKV